MRPLPKLALPTISQRRPNFFYPQKNNIEIRVEIRPVIYCVLIQMPLTYSCIILYQGASKNSFPTALHVYAVSKNTTHCQF